MYVLYLQINVNIKCYSMYTKTSKHTSKYFRLNYVLFKLHIMRLKV